MTKIKRNDPCHCGSEQKYKRCCLPKEEEQRRQQIIEEQQEQQETSTDDYYHEDLQDEHCEDDEVFNDDTDEKNDNEYDPYEDQKFWNEFQKKDYAQRVDIFKEKLDDEDENLLQQTITSCDKLKNNLIDILRKQLGDVTVEDQIIQAWQL